jgi:hypothetical protein
VIDTTALNGLPAKPSKVFRITDNYQG